MKHLDMAKDMIRLSMQYDKYFDKKDILLIVGHREMSEMSGISMGSAINGNFYIDGIPVKLIECESVFSLTTKTAYKAIINGYKRDLLSGISRLNTIAEDVS